MSSIVILIIVLLIIAVFCLIFLFFHHSGRRQRTHALQRRLKKMTHDHRLEISLTEETGTAILGLDAHNNKLVVCRLTGDSFINLDKLKRCSKQKKWLHIPAEKSTRAETHLEKISLLFEFSDETPAEEFAFYNYHSNSIFQMHELEQKTDYWELLLTRQIAVR